MLTLITAVPGSGKTLYTVQRIDEFLQKREPDPETPLEPRPARLVFTNIPLDVECFPEPGNITLFETPEPGDKKEVFDWRDTPSGSLIIYDEAQFFFPTKVLEKRTEEIIEAMSTHRHQGYDIVVITQSPRLLNATVKSLCGKHIHLYRAFGMEGATVYEWQHQVENPNSRVEQSRAVQTIFKFPKRYYGYYQSAEQHTHKLHFPAKLKRLLALMLLVLAGVGYLFWRDGGLNIVTGGKALAPRVAENATRLRPARCRWTRRSRICAICRMDGHPRRRLHQSAAASPIKNAAFVNVTARVAARLLWNRHNACQRYPNRYPVIFCANNFLE